MAKLTSRERRLQQEASHLRAALNKIRAWAVGTAVGVVDADRAMLELIAKEADDALQGVVEK